MDNVLFSLRMRATRGGNHLSGAERLLPAEELAVQAAALVRRALEHPRGCAESIRLAVDAVAPESIQRRKLLDLTTVPVDDFSQGRLAAARLLTALDIAPPAVAAAMAALQRGAAPGGRPMRGAMLVDAGSGERLEPDRARGVRVSRMDLDRDAEDHLRPLLKGIGLDNPHVREALVLASKVTYAPGVVAELCWSDDPGYVAGYVAARSCGYVRFPHLKPLGEERGGRAFFVRREMVDLPGLIAYLEGAAVVLDDIGCIGGDTTLEALL